MKCPKCGNPDAYVLYEVTALDGPEIKCPNCKYHWIGELEPVTPAATLFCECDGGFEIIQEVLEELQRADAKYAHDPMSSAELGLATIRCEFVELEREVVRPVRNEDWLKKEAIQGCAMYLKFLRDVCK